MPVHGYEGDHELNIGDNRITDIPVLGEAQFDSTLEVPWFVEDGQRVLIEVDHHTVGNAYHISGNYPSFEAAGPRKKIFFDPTKTKAAVVTCGGLCPGLNNVIQSIVKTLYFQYNIRDILGVPYGYEGLAPKKYGHGFIPLHPHELGHLHRKGGTMLGTSRGEQDIGEMVDTLVENNIDILFAIGGDGTLRGAHLIHEEIQRRGLNIAVAGVPKTIDNDISFVQKSFGFSTAVEVATQAVHGANAEAESARNGIGLVKLMGRHSGFIAAYTAIASTEVNYVFIPEVKFRMHGEGGFLEHLEKRLKDRGHAVIIVAEGAGQDLMEDTGETDASGNVKLADIGSFMKKEITGYLKSKNMEHTLKYIDPSYIIRSMPASVEDGVYTIMLAQNAVHAAMAGKSDFLVSLWNSYYTLVPIPLATHKRKQISPNGYLWNTVKEATGMPDFI